MHVHVCVHIYIYSYTTYRHCTRVQGWGFFLCLPPLFSKYHCSKILSRFDVIEPVHLCFSGDIQNLGSWLSRQDLEKFVPKHRLKAPISVSWRQWPDAFSFGKLRPQIFTNSLIKIFWSDIKIQWQVDLIPSLRNSFTSEIYVNLQHSEIIWP